MDFTNAILLAKHVIIINLDAIPYFEIPGSNQGTDTFRPNHSLLFSCREKGMWPPI